MPYFVLDNQPFFASEQQYLADGTPLPTVSAPDSPGQIWDGSGWVDPPPPKVVDMATFKRACMVVYTTHITELRAHNEFGYNLITTVFGSVVAPTSNQDGTFNFTSADGAMLAWNSAMPSAIAANAVTLTTEQLNTYNNAFSTYLLGRYQMLTTGEVDIDETKS